MVRRAALDRAFKVQVLAGKNQQTRRPKMARDLKAEIAEEAKKFPKERSFWSAEEDKVIKIGAEGKYNPRALVKFLPGRSCKAIRDRIGVYRRLHA
jgi:hypothetical protein